MDNNCCRRSCNLTDVQKCVIRKCEIYDHGRKWEAPPRLESCFDKCAMWFGSHCQLHIHVFFANVKYDIWYIMEEELLMWEMWVLYLMKQIWFWSCSMFVCYSHKYVIRKCEIWDQGSGLCAGKVGVTNPRSAALLQFPTLCLSFLQSQLSSKYFPPFSFCPNFYLIPLPIIYLSYFVSIFYCAVYILTFLQIPNKSQFSLTNRCTHAHTFPEYP